MSDDHDFEALGLSPQVRLAALSMSVAGFLCLLLGLQTNSILRSGVLYWTAVPLMALLGATMLVCAVQLARMRGWASRVGMLTGGLTAILALAWLVLISMSSVFSVMAVVMIPASAVACLLVRGTRSATQAADSARARLEAAGLDAGF